MLTLLIIVLSIFAIFMFWFALNDIYEEMKKVKVWTLTDNKIIDGKVTWVWRNQLTNETRYLHQDASNDPEYQQVVRQKEIDEAQKLRFQRPEYSERFKNK